MSGRRAKLDRKAYREELEKPTVGDAEPRESTLALIRAADDFLNGKRARTKKRRYAVCLLICDLERPKTEQRVNYASTGLDREDVTEMFEELISRWRANEDSGIPERVFGYERSA